MCKTRSLKSLHFTTKAHKIILHINGSIKHLIKSNHQILTSTSFLASEAIYINNLDLVKGYWVVKFTLA